MAALAVAFLDAPILFPVLCPFCDGRSISRLDGVSLRWCAEVLANEEIGRTELNSVLLQVIAASLATVMANAGGALATMRMRVREKFRDDLRLRALLPWYQGVRRVR